MTIVTRIAPSPTGDMHIGTARTALFNYLYAKRMGGKMLLRIEDTDRERSTDEAVDVIFEGLKWLGIKYDDAPVFQSTRENRHVEIAYDLLARGHAYKCYLSPDELAAMKVQGTAFRSPWRDDQKFATDAIGDDAPFVVRFKGPLDGKTVVKDLIRGDVEFDNSVLDDMIILRSDGTPTYNLAVVVDDIDMGVTHVIRGDDHLNNAARQSLIYKALGIEVPVYAHVPLIYGPDGKKLSKRHGAASVLDFDDLGYLPESLVNYITRLGWGHEDMEIFSMADAIKVFDIADVVSAPARMDFDKLNYINQHYISTASDGRLHSLLRYRHFPDATVEEQERILAILPLVKMGAQTLPKLAEAVSFVLLDDMAISPKASTMLADPVHLDRYRRLVALISADDLDFVPDVLNKVIHDFVHNEGVKMGAVGPILRGVLVGDRNSPDLGTTLFGIGRIRSLARMRRALEMFKS